MRDITGLIGRDALVEKAAQEVRKGRHVILTGKVGVGKSSVLDAILERLERRREERAPVDMESDDPPPAPNPHRQRRTQTVIHIADHQPKAQFIGIARKLLAAGLLDPITLDVKGTIYTDESNFGLATNASGDTLYVTNSLAAAVSKVELKEDGSLERVRFSNTSFDDTKMGPRTIRHDSQQGRVYVGAVGAPAVIWVLTLAPSEAMPPGARTRSSTKPLMWKPYIE